MKILQTNFQKTQANQPTQFDFLTIINRRGSHHFSEEKKLFKNIAIGNQGEEKVLSYIQKYGDPQWTVLRNVWLNHFGTFECDIILITRRVIYIFEIKNYSGKFTYDHGKCFFEEAETKTNPIEQVRANKVELQRICSQIGLNLPVKAAVIFAGDDSEVSIQSNLEDIQVVKRAEIKRFIQQIANLENQSTKQPLRPNTILERLEPYETVNPFMREPLTPGEMKQIRGGIYCADCHNFHLQTSKLYVTCSCGLSESREEAILRTVCDYGVLTYNQKMARQDLFEFFNGQVSLSLLKRTLKQHMQMVNKGRFSYCINENVPYEKLPTPPQIKRQRRYREPSARKHE